ncbi:peptidyl-tRNA hydrolase Pth2 [Dactylosporangium sp. CA-139114]|uniref:peptidyl-tRNA hydrolase Pth2 n=1 Tax=unclassified Dactylosporangium TaxID=2621675 RepID=UPI0033258FB7|nr:peptidyl-tRNA hydrolase Pth2 [Dactylosporangium thailandense]
MSETRLVIVMRTDLGMGKGKMAAQAAHAAVIAALRNQSTPAFADWWRAGQPKVVLKVADEDTLGLVVAAAGEAGLPVEVVHDAGRTQVAAGTATCCAIGPATHDALRPVTGSLSLL